MEPDQLQATVIACLFGFTEVGVAALMIIVNWRAATGRLARNQWTGIRTPSTMRNDQAWRAGHRAALRLTPMYVVNAVAACAVLAFAAVRSWSPGSVWILAIGCLAVIIAVAIITAVVAGKAARLATDGPIR